MMLTAWAALIFVSHTHAATGSGVDNPTSTSWRVCAEHVASNAALTPPVRHSFLGHAQSRSWNPKVHIAAMQSRVADLASLACPGTQQPTLVFTTIGGFGDRLRGMVTTFYTALLTHATFRMSWMVPASVAPYFEVDPALLWKEDKPHSFGDGPGYEAFAEHLVIPGSAAVDVIDVYGFFTDPASDFVTGLAPPVNGTVTVLRTNAPSWLEVVKHPSLRRAADLYGLTDLSRRDLFVLALQIVLDRPSPSVIKAAVSTLPPVLQAPVSQSLARGFENGMNRGGDTDGRRHLAPNWRSMWRSTSNMPRSSVFKAQLPAKPSTKRTGSSSLPLALIGVQIRTGGVGEAWEDARRHPLEAARCFADRAIEVCSDVYARSCAIFLTADSRAAADVFVSALNGTNFTVAQNDGPILHTDRGIPVTADSNLTAATALPSADPWLKTYADWVVLTQADVLLISQSGYGLTAAWAGSVPHMWQFKTGEAECGWVRLDECAQNAFEQFG